MVKQFQMNLKLTIHLLAIQLLGIKLNKHSNENYALKNRVEIAVKKFE